MSTTLLTLQQECARACGWYGSVTPSEATSAAATTITANAITSQLDSDDQSETLQYDWARVDADSAGSPTLVGTTRRITGYTPGSGLITVSRAFHASDGIATTHTIGLYRTVPPDQWLMAQGWKQYINQVLRNLRYRRQSLLTLVTDGDMETSGTTNWTASNCTLTKSTTASAIGHGAQALNAANTAANGYARSVLFPTGASQTYEVRADVRITSGTAHLVAYDETNSAEIQSENTDDLDQRSMGFSFTTPGTCLSLSVRLKGAEASADITWDNVSLRPQGARVMDLPSWVDRPTAVEGLVYYLPASGHGSGDLFRSMQHYPLRGAVISDLTGATAYRVRYSRSVSSDAALWVEGLSAYGELSAITDTTVADEYLVVNGACLLAATDLDDKRLKERFLPRWLARVPSLPTAGRLIPELV